jgi:hypothetical protein
MKNVLVEGGVLNARDSFILKQYMCNCGIDWLKSTIRESGGRYNRDEMRVKLRDIINAIKSCNEIDLSVI